MSNQQQATVEPLTDEHIEMVVLALRRAWNLGQTFWQQADSESYSQNRKSDQTQAKFDELTEKTAAALALLAATPTASYSINSNNSIPSGSSPEFPDNSIGCNSTILKPSNSGELESVASKADEQSCAWINAYEGAMEDMAIWKKRALEAEDSCRRLTAALNAENGPTFMGEPALATSKADTGELALPVWVPCNPACDPECNGYRDKLCDCPQARKALKSTAPSPIKAEPTASASLIAAAREVVDDALEGAEDNVHVCDRDKIAVKLVTLKPSINALYRALQNLKSAVQAEPTGEQS